MIKFFDSLSVVPGSAPPPKVVRTDPPPPSRVLQRSSMWGHTSLKFGHTLFVESTTGDSLGVSFGASIFDTPPKVINMINE